MSTRIVHLTESEARAILSWCEGPERAGYMPTDAETTLGSKMTQVLASFAAWNTLTAEEVEVIEALRSRTKG